MLGLNIELESSNIESKKWNLLIPLPVAEPLVEKSPFNEAIKTASAVWELTKENGKENEIKLKC
jgi:hypothetical protein